MRKKQKKTIFIFIIIGAVLLGFTIYYCYPTFVNVFYQAQKEIGDYGDSLLKPNDTTQTSNGDKPTPIRPIIVDENNVNYDTYSDQYWADIEKGKKQDYAFTNELLKNIDTVISNSKDNNELYCVLPFGNTQIQYTVEQISFANNLEEFDVDFNSPEIFEKINNSEYSNGNGGLNNEYHFAAVKIKMTNVGDSVAFDFPTRGFSYDMIDNTQAVYSCSFIYGTLQPGQGTHSYYAAELSVNETMETTAVFAVPKDNQFEAYEKFIFVNPQGYGDYSPENVSLIPVGKLLG